jgi:hypothetical protein
VQKAEIGKCLFARVAQCKPEQASKITSKLLEMPLNALLTVMEDEDLFIAEVERAAAAVRPYVIPTRRSSNGGSSNFLSPPPRLLPLTAAALASKRPEEQKRMIGERLFPKVAHVVPNLAPTIMGMLLEMGDLDLLLRLLEDEDRLLDEVDEVIEALNQHNMKK